MKPWLHSTVFTSQSPQKKRFKYQFHNFRKYYFHVVLCRFAVSLFRILTSIHLHLFLKYSIAVNVLLHNWACSFSQSSFSFLLSNCDSTTYINPHTKLPVQIFGRHMQHVTSLWMPNTRNWWHPVSFAQIQCCLLQLIYSLLFTICISEANDFSDIS